MKMRFLVFFSIVLLIYAGVNFYIWYRGYHALQYKAEYQSWFTILFVFLAVSYVAGRVLEKVYLSTFSDIFIWIGSFWLAAMLYFFLIVLLVDIVRLGFAISGAHLGSLFPDYGKVKYWFFVGSTIVVVLAVIAGHINALNPRINKIPIELDNNNPDEAKYRIALASDIHLGTIINKRRLSGLVDRINGLDPDLVILAGDIVDEDLEPVIRHKLGQKLSNLQPRIGVFAVTGNHEYIGGAERAVGYLKEFGVTFLRDSVISIEGNFYLAGREDRDRPRFSGKERLEKEILLKKVIKDLPVILIDHQPFGIEESNRLGVDISLSGHTHHGQMWPLNYLTKAIYTVSAGYKKVGNTHVVVSTGYGTWGPPVRTGNRPEIILIDLKIR